MSRTRVIGLISGTSMDAVDVAVADLRLDDGNVELATVGHAGIPYPGELRAELAGSLPPAPCTAETLCRLDTAIGQAFADVARTAQREIADGAAELVCSLGQTVYHWVEGTVCLGTMQLGQPAWIAEATGLPVVADLRARDVAAGGHGAPLASTLDRLWLRDLAESAGRPVAALNIGGIANITIVRPDRDAGENVIAYDTGPGNALLDIAAHQATGGRIDVDGALASAGRVRDDLLDRLLAEPYYRATPPKSTGKELFHAGYLRAAVEGLPPIAPEDLLATLTGLTARTIADACARHGVGTVVASGGGVDNPALLSALRRDLGDTRLCTSDELGLPRSAKEAYLTALLGWLTWHGLPANVPAATGAGGWRLLGSVTPGASALSLPRPRSTPVTRLRVTAAAPQLGPASGS